MRLNTGDPYWQTPEGKLRDPVTERRWSDIRAEEEAREAAQRPMTSARVAAQNAKIEAQQEAHAALARAAWREIWAAHAKAKRRGRKVTAAEQRRLDELLERANSEAPA
ncbi:MAG TPA: hypothetical protein VFA43_10685 [Gemmatimonadaceae bacterium]|nr:hypothetical protein [Gemmatimonadaceae bacterium]